ncbi:MAG: hypothetical protein VZR27_02805 [Acutalibacteraceae bacterium]|nr:hypothetical protein [Clostridia bacterium]MEE3449618.1 hypothetical protein [Acutalibacteraceae bacterium]
MSLKMRLLCVFSALCFLGSIACFSGVAAENLYRISGDEDIVVDPGVQPDPVVPDPVVPDPAAPDPVAPDPDPIYVDPTPDPVVSDYTDYPNTPVYDTDNGGYNQPVDPGVNSYNDYNSYYYEYPVESYNAYIDYTSQYIENTYNAYYDDNYYYVPEYTAPTENLIDASSKVIDTDELSADDWNTIMLSLENGKVSDDGTKTFNFIKNNEQTGDTSITWMLYLGCTLIVSAVFVIIFVIISTKKAKRKLRYS